ncbi:site-specific integrase [Lactococcus lactis]|uniref:Site-specific integrase n=1 Tax=Lactococcus lactis TaxID=1358 RepID=A0AAW8UHK3_9LACT|nr:site-specific integrase [Lactococcus lactis]MDT2882014.1 site-specific integrase [Lactococcus lactis]MDT2946828.1 site-specific integrase [Lactococcus lactis]MDT2947647.1 site-specific integrase [Lactococcus lactis]
MKINKIEKKDGTFVYRTNVYLGVDSLTGKQVRTTATAKTRKMCEMKANQAINNFIKNGKTVARKKVIFDNFNSLALSWFESYKLTVKINTVRVANNFLQVYILPALGNYKVEKITTILLQSIINQWAKNANTSIIKNGRREKGKCKDFKLLLNLIKRILDYAMQLGAISFNPATQVLPPKLKDRRPSTIKYFENDELKKFLDYLNSLENTDENVLNSTLYQFLLATGLRIGEALALNWSDINIYNQTVTINKTIVQSASRKTRIQNGAKTKESNRTVSLDETTIRLLLKWKSIQENKILSLSDRLVFSYNEVLRTYSRSTIILKKHFKAAGVHNIGFHGFRHTHASLLMNNDVNPKEIQMRLGHADYSITMNLYSHLSKDKKKETAEKFANILKAL